MALEGIHPTLRQVPPRVEYFSIMAVLKPSCAQRIADTYPPGPEPIMTTSNEFIVYCFIYYFNKKCYKIKELSFV